MCPGEGRLAHAPEQGGVPGARASCKPLRCLHDAFFCQGILILQRISQKKGANVSPCDAGQYGTAGPEVPSVSRWQQLQGAGEALAG